MRRLLTSLKFLSLLLGSVGLSSCAKHTIVGDWQMVTYSDNGFREFDSQHPIPYSFKPDGTWRSVILDRNGAVGIETTGIYTISGTTLSMTWLHVRSRGKERKHSESPDRSGMTWLDDGSLKLTYADKGYIILKPAPKQ